MPAKVGSVWATPSGELMVTGGAMVAPALTGGKRTVGVLGMLAAIWVTPWFCSLRAKKMPAPERIVSLGLRLYAKPRRGAQLLWSPFTIASEKPFWPGIAM